jgi:hypothetical protein
MVLATKMLSEVLLSQTMCCDHFVGHLVDYQEYWHSVAMLYQHLLLHSVDEKQ